MMHLVMLCVSFAFADAPILTACETVMTEASPHMVASAYIAANVDAESFDTVWHETSGNSYAHVVCSIDDPDADDASDVATAADFGYVAGVQ